MSLNYKRVLIKISGESLADESRSGISSESLSKLAQTLRKVSDTGVQVSIVVGGGNFWRGRTSGSINRVKADHMGMLATVMNALALSDALEQDDTKCSILTSIPFPQIGKPYSPERAISELEKGKVVIFAYGTGSAFFSTDTAASLRAAEINAEVILKATAGVDGVYTSDPRIDSSAKKYDTLTFDEMLSKNLKVIDSTAASMCRDNKIPFLIFNMNPFDNILEALNNTALGTLVTP